MPIALALTLFGIAFLLLASAGGIYYATYAVRSQWLGPTNWCGRIETGAVALTFDDGPSSDTERILDILEEHKLRATFFMIGRHVEQLPQTARRVADEGHEIGNHSYSHPIFLYQNSKATRHQLERTQAIITASTGVTPKLARPPCGVRTPAYFEAARSLGLRTVQWELAGFDWKRRSAKQIAHDVLSRARAGSIILLHDGDSEGARDRHETVAALPLIIEGLGSCGLRIVPLTELLGEKDVRIAA
jgi:peptidoglycan/xylan/chitin deacetylase (PgdA/CDA1 family)